MRAIQVQRATAIVVELLFGVVLLVLIALILLDYITLAVVEGMSMEPTLQSGDLVIVVKRVSADDVKAGDVVVYRRGGTLIIHRVVKIESGTLITKGDNNWLPDPPVSFQSVIGKVLEIGDGVFKVPLIGYLTLLARYSITSFTYFPVLGSLDRVFT